jgi:hypothetical protein
VTEFEKDVSGSEKFMIAYNELRPPFVIQLTLEGAGSPEPEALHEALEKTTEANPGSSLRVDRDRDPLKWVIGPPPTLTLVDAPDWDGYSDVNAPFLRWTLDCFSGPTCELVRVQAKDRTYLIFRAAHAVMDGQGTLNWVRDYMRCLRGEEPLGHASSLCVDELIGDIRTEPRPLPKPDALHPFGQADMSSPGTYHWMRVRVDRPLDSGVSGRIAVSLADKARATAEGTVRLNLPTDLRHYRPEERTTGNMFNSLFIEVPPDAQAEMVGMQIVRQLYKNIGASPMGVYGQEVGPLNIHRVKVLWDIAHLHDTGRYAFSATLSHLGVVDPAELSAPCFETESVFFVPLVGDSGCVVSVNGVGEHTELTVGLSDRFLVDHKLSDLASLMRTAIRG